MEEASPTFGAEVVHQNDFFNQARGRSAEDAVNGAEEGGPHFIHEAHDDGGGREVVVNPLLRAPATATRAHRRRPVALLGTSRLRVCWENAQGGVTCQM